MVFLPTQSLIKAFQLKGKSILKTLQTHLDELDQAISTARKHLRENKNPTEHNGSLRRLGELLWQKWALEGKIEGFQAGK